MHSCNSCIYMSLCYVSAVCNRWCTLTGLCASTVSVFEKRFYDKLHITGFFSNFVFRGKHGRERFFERTEMRIFCVGCTCVSIMQKGRVLQTIGHVTYFYTVKKGFLLNFSNYIILSHVVRCAIYTNPLNE